MRIPSQWRSTARRTLEWPRNSGRLQRAISIARATRIDRPRRQKAASERLVYTGIDVPDDAVIDVGSLPDGWNASPHTAISQRIGDAWVACLTSVALRVPSVIVPSEFNVLLHPRHQQFAAVTAAEVIDAVIDTRLI